MSASQAGRPEGTAERWAARQFVLYAKAWLDAGGGSQWIGDTALADPQTSGAVMCLAAIFVAGGENEVRARECGPVGAEVAAEPGLPGRPDCLPDDRSGLWNPPGHTASLKS